MSRRSDMSSYLIHWTAKDDFDAIIRSGFLVPSNAARWHDVLTSEEGKHPTIYGPWPAVCFSEMPIGNWIQSMAACHRYSEHRWGIAIPKKILYAYGARPVLYVEKDGDLWKTCPEEERYRLCNFRYVPKPDWTHEREWRVRANVEFNHQIGLKGDTILYGKQIVKGDSLVPIHLPDLADKEELDSVLPDTPRFVVIVEAELNTKEISKQVPNPATPLAKALEQHYSPIGEYRDKYLPALKKAPVISLEYAKDMRDREGLWSIEDILSSQQKSQLMVMLWDKASTEARRQVLSLIGEEPGNGHEFCCGRDLRSIPSRSLFQSLEWHIERCEQAINILRTDVKSWLDDLLESVLQD